MTLLALGGALALYGGCSGVLPEQQQQASQASPSPSCVWRRSNC
jgi:hypothetical protein